MKRVLFLCLFVLFGGCSGLTSPDGPVLIRVGNASTVTYDRVVVAFPEGPTEFGPVPPGGTSGYVDAPGAYRYASIQVDMGESTRSLTAIDFVGEHPLDAGSYTYAIGFDESGGLSLELIVED